MPGLFGDSGDVGAGILGGLTRSLFPGFYNEGLRQQQLQGMQQMQPGMTPQQASLAHDDPAAYEAMWKQKIFMDQYAAWQQQPENKGKSFNQFLYDISAPGQELNYGLKAGQPIEGEGGMKVPTGFYHGQPFVGMPGAPQNGGAQTGIQAPPSQQPQPQQAQGPAAAPAPPPGMAQAQPYINYLRQQNATSKAANETAVKQADSLQQYPAALVAAKTAVARLEALRDNPQLSTIVGGTMGVKGRTAALGQGQADLVNEVNELQGQVIGNVLQATRGASGRSVNPGTLKELTAGAGNLIDARKGTAEGMQKVINNSINLIKDETGAAWEGTGRKGEQPTWGPPATSRDPLANARAAIAKGAPRDQVILRLKQHGIDAAGL